LEVGGGRSEWIEFGSGKKRRWEGERVRGCEGENLGSGKLDCGKRRREIEKLRR
jgi:hypothetical protein